MPWGGGWSWHLTRVLEARVLLWLNRIDSSLPLAKFYNPKHDRQPQGGNGSKPGSLSPPWASAVPSVGWEDLQSQPESQLSYNV